MLRQVCKSLFFCARIAILLRNIFPAPALFFGREVEISIMAKNLSANAVESTYKSFCQYIVIFVSLIEMS